MQLIFFLNLTNKNEMEMIKIKKKLINLKKSGLVNRNVRSRPKVYSIFGYFTNLSHLIKFIVNFILFLINNLKCKSTFR